MILYVSISSPEKQKGNHRFGSEVEERGFLWCGVLESLELETCASASESLSFRSVDHRVQLASLAT